MSGELLRLKWDQSNFSDCVCLLVVPERAVEEPGYINGMHMSGATNKHEFQALAQTAYYQFQDDELDFTVASEQILILGHRGENDRLDDGMILFRDADGAIKAVVHETARFKKLLEAANRFCTRWVRLDI